MVLVDGGGEKRERIWRFRVSKLRLGREGAN